MVAYSKVSLFITFGACILAAINNNVGFAAFGVSGAIFTACDAILNRFYKDV